MQHGRAPVLSRPFLRTSNRNREPADDVGNGQLRQETQIAVKIDSKRLGLVTKNRRSLASDGQSNRSGGAVPEPR